VPVLQADEYAQQQLSILGNYSAYHQIITFKRLLLFLIWISVTVTGIIAPMSAGIVIFCTGFINYLILLAFRISNNAVESNSSSQPFDETGSDQWPSFSILVPLKNENEVIEATLAAIDLLHYPDNLKQVIIIVEETDTVTQQSLSAIDLPYNFEILYIPENTPHTKARALLHGLKVATGEYLTVYDAESRPEPDQLKKAALSLTGSSIPLCLQAKIKISNQDTNWLTRNFAAEYHEWYYGRLYKLSASGLPFGLGGNSFFISTSELEKAGSWDPFNVTEDADLSVRLVRHGVQLQLLDSITTESCPSEISSWINQRTRWNKGLFTTQLVHIPKSLSGSGFSAAGWRSFWSPMVCAAFVPFFNLYIPLYMLFSKLPFPLLSLFNMGLWLLFGFNLVVAGMISRRTYRNLKLKKSLAAVFLDSFRYLFLQIAAGFKAYFEYFISPLQWHKTAHHENETKPDMTSISTQLTTN
jgi:glycosyltransferase XagB